jgi:hypothetical protein
MRLWRVILTILPHFGFESGKFFEVDNIPRESLMSQGGTTPPQSNKLPKTGFTAAGWNSSSSNMMVTSSAIVMGSVAVSMLLIGGGGGAGHGWIFVLVNHQGG